MSSGKEEFKQYIEDLERELDEEKNINISDEKSQRIDALLSLLALYNDINQFSMSSDISYEVNARIEQLRKWFEETGKDEIRKHVAENDTITMDFIKEMINHDYEYYSKMTREEIVKLNEKVKQDAIAIFKQKAALETDAEALKIIHLRQIQFELIDSLDDCDEHPVLHYIPNTFKREQELLNPEHEGKKVYNYYFQAYDLCTEDIEAKPVFLDLSIVRKHLYQNPEQSAMHASRNFEYPKGDKIYVFSFYRDPNDKENDSKYRIIYENEKDGKSKKEKEQLVEQSETDQKLEIITTANTLEEAQGWFQKSSIPKCLAYGTAAAAVAAGCVYGLIRLSNGDWYSSLQDGTLQYLSQAAPVLDKIALVKDYIPTSETITAVIPSIETLRNLSGHFLATSSVGGIGIGALYLLPKTAGVAWNTVTDVSKWIYENPRKACAMGAVAGCATDYFFMDGTVLYYIGNGVSDTATKIGEFFGDNFSYALENLPNLPYKEKVLEIAEFLKTQVSSVEIPGEAIAVVSVAAPLALATVSSTIQGVEDIPVSLQDVPETVREPQPESKPSVGNLGETIEKPSEPQQPTPVQPTPAPTSTQPESQTQQIPPTPSQPTPPSVQPTPISTQTTPPSLSSSSPTSPSTTMSIAAMTAAVSSLFVFKQTSTRKGMMVVAVTLFVIGMIFFGIGGFNILTHLWYGGEIFTPSPSPIYVPTCKPVPCTPVPCIPVVQPQPTPTPNPNPGPINVQNNNLTVNQIRRFVRNEIQKQTGVVPGSDLQLGTTIPTASSQVCRKNSPLE